LQELTLRNALKEKLDRGEVASAMAVRLVTGNEIVPIASSAGFDSIYVDLEHSSFSIETASRISLAALAEGLTCLVRVPDKAPHSISRALDGGALGIIAPDVRTAEEAQAVVRAAKYAPEGRRGISAALPHFGFRSFPAREGFDLLNTATMVIVQCESDQAVANAGDIAAVEGVDMILVGTNDLLADKGLAGEFDHPYVREAYEKVLAACRARGKHSGIGGLTARPQLMAELVKRGARYVSMGTDLGFLLESARSRAEWVRDLQAHGHQ
jgi:4-hydroxy-2-oxoheptanedioate aldolase